MCQGRSQDTEGGRFYSHKPVRESLGILLITYGGTARQKPRTLTAFYPQGKAFPLSTGYDTKPQNRLKYPASNRHSAALSGINLGESGYSIRRMSDYGKCS